MRKEFFGLECIIILLQLMIFSAIFSIARGESITSQANQATASEVSKDAKLPQITSNINDADFKRALPHILKYEGECSDHFADKGGRTYKGITWRVARKFGYKGDVCNLTDAQVADIYYRHDWARVPQAKAFPEKLAYFNMIVNGTRQGCLLRKDAESMLDCQQNYYDSLSARNRKYFGNGWRNRNNYFLSVIMKLRQTSAITNLYIFLVS